MLTHRAHRKLVVAVVVVPVVVPVRVVRIEVQVVGVVLVVRRRRPVVAVGTDVVELAIPDVTRSGKETPCDMKT